MSAEPRTGGLLRVRSGLSGVDQKSPRLVPETRLGEAGELAAVMRVLAVHLDRAARRAAPLPEEIATRALGRASGGVR